MKKIVHRLGAKKWIKRLGLGVLPLIIGGIWQNVMQEKESQLFPPPGKIITVQSHDMHLYGTGTGKSTIVFIPGSGTPNAFTDFYYLQKELQLWRHFRLLRSILTKLQGLCYWMEAVLSFTQMTQKQSPMH
ncbi:hypothetical protein [uncultured Brevibacillus sp.]|uniref:hypothetical protein n=1 Tax=uncultured Brevibacillus sp. TaxID=169970 RepID=UPI002591B513|nr:hypothetical protein [uncultured Brevibacillus sp.]